LSTFIVLAALMAAAAIALIAWPILKSRKGEGGHAATGTAVVVALAIPLAAFLLYREWSNWNWDPAAQVAQSQGHEMDAAIQALEARLAANDQDADGWMLLGRSYLVTNQFQKATGAYERAYRITDGKNAEAVLGYAEAMSMADETAIGGRAGELFEAALKLEPQNPKALWYGGLAAMRRNDAATARDRWAALSALNPPPEVKSILDERVAELDRQLGRPVQASSAGAEAPAMASAASSQSGAAQAPTQPAAAAAPGSVRVKLSIAPALAAKVPAGAPLFVLARDPTNPGPPLAAKRLGGIQLPYELVLSDADAMAAGRTISGAKSLTIVARFSSSGMPMASSGDLYGEVSYDPASRKGAPVEITIDKTVP
jgi:cytochrome c-type biogenesis protein CcmH